MTELAQILPMCSSLTWPSIIGSKFQCFCWRTWCYRGSKIIRRLWHDVVALVAGVEAIGSRPTKLPTTRRSITFPRRTDPAAYGKLEDVCYRY